jgi:glutathione S-transferase
MKVIGNYISPYVRKVLACLHLKGLSYEIDPIIPFYTGEDITKLNPLRRIPVLIDGDLTLCDSSVICQYLEEAYPDRPLLPANAKDRARARWLEEFADTRLGDVFIWGLFFPVVAHEAIWGEKGDHARAERSVTKDAPAVLDYLESQVPAKGFLFGEIGLADISIAVFFRNAAWARFTVDAARWPKTAAFVARALDHPALAQLQPFENVQMGASFAGRCDILEEVGAPITPVTMNGITPKWGIAESRPGAG